MSTSYVSTQSRLLKEKCDTISSLSSDVKREFEEKAESLYREINLLYKEIVHVSEDENIVKSAGDYVASAFINCAANYFKTFNSNGGNVRFSQEFLKRANERAYGGEVKARIQKNKEALNKYSKSTSQNKAVTINYGNSVGSTNGKSLNQNQTKGNSSNNKAYKNWNLYYYFLGFVTLFVIIIIVVSIYESPGTDSTNMSSTKKEEQIPELMKQLSVITAENVKLREYPTTNSEVVTLLSQYKEVEVLASTELDGTDVVLNTDQEVWIGDKKRTLPAGVALKIIGDDGYAIRCTFMDSKGEEREISVYEHEVDEMTNKWYKVKLNDGRTGWVYGDFINVNE